MKLVVEIRAAEGGDDAKSLVIEQSRIYQKYCTRNGLWMDVVEVQPGYIQLLVSGQNCHHLFRNEPGGHRWQRVPPNERSGRVHTSTITVAVLPVPERSEIKINPNDVEMFACIGHGKGGQNKQKTSSAITLHHKPTGIRIFCQDDRSQLLNKENAMSILLAKLSDIRTNGLASEENMQRRRQVGSGMRGDKRRTIAVQRGTVDDHETNERFRLKEYLDGRFSF